MKRRILFLLALVAMTGLAKDVVVERPAFRSLMKNFYYKADIWPVKVELTKHATVVHFHVACAARSGWSTDGGWLEVDGRQFAYQKGRILMHDGSKVLADDDLELGKDYERNAQRDSLILYFYNSFLDIRDVREPILGYSWGKDQALIVRRIGKCLMVRCLYRTSLIREN